ncbi:MFS general substrate transporter [Daldinia caldariorum]|uniref:MFS general substrate transporter n=1 Tax=Daldinia caldariorum TaxID=326644 RepID=UPI0020079272|nr:MFS general substrate transporter [Daldinia caldariorum]KAI1464230.1 MFS general substrate transporter [Daldinia caldariorum]
MPAHQTQSQDIPMSEVSRLPTSQELQDSDNAPTTELPPAETIISPAAPQSDRSKSAYLVLAGCVLIQAPIWGYSLAFGIFQEYYTAHGPAVLPDGPGTPGTIASIGNSQTGILYLMMPATFILLTKYPYLRRWCGPLGLLVTTACLLASSFATSARQLIATQGVLHAVGCGLLFSPASLSLDEWFSERKGLAYGAMWASKSTVGAGMPFLTSALLSRFGVRTTLRAYAASSALLTIPPLFLIREYPAATTTSEEHAFDHQQQQPGRRQRQRGRVSFAFARHSTFWILQWGNVLQSLGYLMPPTYLASYAHALGFPSVTGPIFLALISLASVPGSLLIGLLNDAGLAPTTVILISSLGSAASVFLLWGLGGHQVAVLVVFTLMYGFFAGGFSSTWSGILQEMKRRDGAIDTALIFGMLLGGRGLGFVLSGPIGGALLEANRLKAQDFTGYATQYGPMVIYTGLTATLGAWGWFWTMGKQVMRAL